MLAATMSAEHGILAPTMAPRSAIVAAAMLLAACGGDERPGTARQVGGPTVGGPVPAVRILDAEASATLRRTYANAAGEWPAPDDLAREGAWIDSVARPLRAFWKAHADRVLADLADYAGTRWVESSFNVYLIRRPVGVTAFSLPLVLDLSAFERVPPDRADFYYGLLEWALVHELVHRVRDQPWIARSTVGREAEETRVVQAAGSAHDWDDVVTAFVLRDVVGESRLRPLLYNHALQRTIGVYRLDRIATRFLDRWHPSRDRPLGAWLAAERDPDTGFHHPAAERRLAALLAGAGYVPAGTVEAAADSLRREFGLGPEEVAQLLSDWDGANGEGRLLGFPYRAADGAWEWQRSR
jgi:hypothetical protein